MALTTSELDTIMGEVLAYLQIDWEDETLTKKLRSGVQRGVSLLEDYAGTKLDFLSPGTPQGLLLDYMRYVHYAATEQFERNYQRDLLRLRDLYGVGLSGLGDTDNETN